MTISAIESGTLMVQLATAAARTIVLAAFASLLLAAFRVKSTVLRLFTWTAVLYAGLSMPLLGGILPSVRIPVPFATVAEPVKAVSQESPTLSAPTRIVTVREVGPPAEPTPSVASTSPVLSKPISWRTRITAIPWTTAALAIYLAVGLFLLTRLIIGVVLARRLVRNSVALDDSRIRALTHAANSVRVAEIRESQSVSVPLTIGVFMPVIMLPASWREWNDHKLAGVLAHEMSHVTRHDCLSQYLSLIHRAVFWFSPLAWWLNRHIIELAEQASDEEALARGTDQNSYARILLGFVEIAQAGRARWQGVSMASSGRTEKRLEKVLAWRGDKKMAPRKSALIAVAVLAIPVSYVVAASRPVSPSAAAQSVAASQDQAPAASQQPMQPPAAISAPADTAPASALPPQAPGAASSDVTPAAPASPGSPAMPSEDVLAAKAAQDEANEGRHRGSWYRYGYDEEQRFVIVSGKSNSFTMSGSGEDARHAEKLKQHIPGDFIWFERDEKSYIIRDQATVERARQLWAPQEELGKKQAALGKQQEALGKQQEELGRRMQAVRVKVPDMTAELDKLKAELQQLGPDATVEQIGRIQSEIGRLQSKIGRIQSDAGDEQGKVGEEMGELGAKQGELGRQQGELGRQQGELAEKANREMRQLLDDAIKKGTAQPEASESGSASL